MARRGYDSFGPSYSQPSAELLRRHAQESIAKAGKKGRVYQPVIPRGNSRTICVSWWGKAWCSNMERYADYGSRLPRGRRYISSGAVIDLTIEEGMVHAKVQGSRRTPYSVVVRIDPLPEKKQQALIEKCSRQIHNLEDLIYGRFPDDLKDLFLEKGGLFPSPREIHFDCSCPDWASMCKHVAAVMYAIGVRLDDNPFYFFTLRGADVDAFVAQALENRVESMLKNADCITDRVIPESDISSLFGVL